MRYRAVPMKNKHLVFLFLAILFGSLIFRWMPLHGDREFRRDIIRLPVDSLTQIVIQSPADPEPIIFNRLDTAWSATHGNRTMDIPTARMRPLLMPLAAVRSLRFATESTDNQLFLEKATHLQAFVGAKKVDEFWLGACPSDVAPSSFVRLDSPREIFEVEGDVACRWQQLRFDDFRSREVCDCSADKFGSVEFSWAEFPPMFLEERAEDWATPGGIFRRSPEQMQAFFRDINLLKINAFADDFDDANRRESFVGRILLNRKSSEQSPVELTCFRSEKNAPRFVLHSSENPGNYFFPDDSLAVRLFLRPIEWGAKPPKTGHEN